MGMDALDQQLMELELEKYGPEIISQRRHFRFHQVDPT